MQYLALAFLLFCANPSYALPVSWNYEGTEQTAGQRAYAGSIRFESATPNTSPHDDTAIHPGAVLAIDLMIGGTHVVFDGAGPNTWSQIEQIVSPGGPDYWYINAGVDTGGFDPSDSLTVDGRPARSGSIGITIRGADGSFAGFTLREIPPSFDDAYFTMSSIRFIDPADPMDLASDGFFRIAQPNDIIAIVPEPGTALLLGFGLVFLTRQSPVPDSLCG